MADEYINRAATIEALENKCLYMSIRECPGDCEICEKKAISRIPAADVAPVVHAHWIEQSPDFDLCGVAYYKCSECGKEQQLNSHYCQFCGATMDAVDWWEECNMEVDDMVEVRHGRWIHEEPNGANGFRECLICSECHQPHFGINRNYCPFCGAKMDERSKDE